MEKQIIFRDYMEQQAQDHLDLQDFTRDSFDHLVLDAVTATRRYAGFNVQKTAQTEIQIAPGRFYDVLGAVYHRDTTLVQSMLTYLPAVAKRIVLVSVYGNETETDVEERDFLVDVDTGRTEPEAVATVSSRDAVLALTQGAESADPPEPATPVGHAPIAYVTLDNVSVVSVEMLTDYEVTSTEDLDERADDLETFKSQIEPRVSSLASDLAALAGRINAGHQDQHTFLVNIYQDLAKLKEKVDLPQTYSDYGADNYGDIEHSDYTDSAGLGYDCSLNASTDPEVVQSSGLTFATANRSIEEVSLFSANDPNVISTDGLVLPVFTSVIKLQTGDYTSETGMSQYGYQTFDLVQKHIRRWRLRYGCYWPGGIAWWPWRNWQWYHHFYGLFPDWPWGTWYPWCLGYYYYWPKYWYWYRPYCWVEYYDEAYWELEKTDHQIQGAQIAQTFLVANDTWATKLGFYITAKGAAENIFLTLTEITTGMPDLSKALMHMTYDEGDITVGWNEVDITPTFMKGGSRYALVITSNANHKVGMTSGESYIDGTFFYSTDGVFYLGDLTKDLMLRVYGAAFTNPQCTVEFAGLNLDGGIRAVDLTANTIVPNSTDIVYEIRPNGTGEWIPMTPDDVTALSGAPPLLQFRGRFIGTRDMAAGFKTTGSRMDISRPKTSFKHVSTLWTLAEACDDITVKLTLLNFNDTPHNCTCKLWVDTAYIDPTSTVDVTTDSVNNIIERTFHFHTLSPAISAMRIVVDGSTTSAANLFTVGEMLFWAESGS